MERQIILVAIDRQWQGHLYNMDALREGVHLRAQGQKDPLIEYKNEAYSMFVQLMDQIRTEALQNLFRSADYLEETERRLQAMPRQLSGGESPDGAGPTYSAANIASSGSSGNISPAVLAASGAELKINLPTRKRPVLTQKEVGRNEQCACGSGKKFKNCCGREA
jgi:preprotein translocase subunit SecA